MKIGWRRLAEIICSLGGLREEDMSPPVMYVPSGGAPAACSSHPSSPGCER